MAKLLSSRFHLSCIVGGIRYCKTHAASTAIWTTSRRSQSTNLAKEDVGASEIQAVRQKPLKNLPFVKGLFAGDFDTVSTMLYRIKFVRN